MSQQDHAAIQLILSLDPDRRKEIAWLTETLQERGLHGFDPMAAAHNFTRSLIKRANAIAFKNHQVHLVQLTCFEVVKVDGNGNGKGKSVIRFYKTAGHATVPEAISHLTYRRRAIGGLETRYRTLIEFFEGHYRGPDRRRFSRQLELYDLNPVPA